ncbi:hypothetical protein CRUP_026429 [Coryphaenoides rupestris]|nr:hypothetical protein CRUP_026429 [Coryphaenoides rupestris]
MIASRSAFSVALTNNRWCLGPALSDIDIAYKHVFLNLGGNYNVQNGIYTAPRSGVYSFAFTVYSDAGSNSLKLQACAMLQVNNKTVSIITDRETSDQEDSASSVLALKLNAGDKVVVVLPEGCYLCDDDQHYNTFTGFLLYSSD